MSGRRSRRVIELDADARATLEHVTRRTTEAAGLVRTERLRERVPWAASPQAPQAMNRQPHAHDVPSPGQIKRLTHVAVMHRRAGAPAGRTGGRPGCPLSVLDDRLPIEHNPRDQQRRIVVGR